MSLALHSSPLRRWYRRIQGPPNTASAPRWCWPALIAALALQAALSLSVPRTWQAETSPGRAPARDSLSVWSLGEAELAGYAMSLYVQTFDSQSGRNLRIGSLDQEAIRNWLASALDSNPASSYPLLLASRVYASASQGAEARLMLDWVEQQFRLDPAARWPWLAHAVYVARHELHDMALAKHYARSLAQHSTADQAPAWARQLEIFLLEANNETVAARRLLGGLISSGQIKNAAELQFLAERMKQIPDEARRTDDQRREESVKRDR